MQVIENSISRNCWWYSLFLTCFFFPFALLECTLEFDFCFSSIQLLLLLLVVVVYPIRLVTF